ncbi:putative RNA binding protein [Leptomonas seymouri]|uniref:Putative RNA binding protein n=1 Tax=Leptomonas seymouri TaxID=5684 RepID=A0A0N0P4Z4_LEPSE|nr:putative RNA binding protein [Leptomonas seymouri]|eukprot:KPI85866.1 putative RNA binding protein [Leptomonas seymouri]
MNLSSYSYASQTNYSGRNTPVYPITQSGMYSNGNVNIGHGSAASPSSHASMYATATPSSAQSSNYNSAVQPGGGGAPHITQSQQQQGTTLSYNAYDGGASGLNKANAAGRAGDVFYSGPAMTGHPSAAGQSMYQANAPATALFQMGPSSSPITQTPSVAQMLSSQQQQQQQQQLNANAAAMAAYANPATNINMGYKLFVGQVPAVCTEEQLRPLFGQFGRLLEIKIMRESNGRSRGSAWVRYESEISAQRAIEALNEKHVVPPQTNALRVQFATPNQNRTQAAAVQLQPSQVHSSATRTISAFIAQSPHQQQQPNYTTTAYASAPHGYVSAPSTTATTYLPQGQYPSPNVISYGSSDGAFSVRAPPQNPTQLSQQQAPPSQQQQQHQAPARQSQSQQQQQFSGRVEYVRACQSGGGMLYTTSVSTAAAGAMQQTQRQGQQQQPQQSTQQQQLVYTTGGQMRTGVVYAPEGFAMANQMSSAQQQQQQQQWRN